MGKLTAPVSIGAGHIADSFGCGVPSLNHWLRRQALKNEASGAFRTFVVCFGEKVVGYYALATGSVLRRQPEPIPVMVLGRLAVDLGWQGSGLGRGMLRDAVLRTYTISRHAGVRALLVHALSKEAKEFYLRNGFMQSPIDPMTLMLNLLNVHRTLEKPWFI